MRNLNHIKVSLSLLFLICLPNLSFGIGKECITNLAMGIVESLPQKGKNSASDHDPNIKVKMRVPLAILGRVDKFGFLNGHQSTRTRGVDLSGRYAMVEHSGPFSNIFSINKSPVFPLGVYPKYGYIYTVDPYLLHTYGEMDVEFDHEKLASRITYTLGDSLELAEKNSKSDQFKIYPLQDKSGLDDFEKNKDKVSDYIEAQIWGPLTLNDVKYINITEDIDDQAKEELSKISQKYGIPIQTKDGQFLQPISKIHRQYHEPWGFSRDKAFTQYKELVPKIEACEGEYSFEGTAFMRNVDDVLEALSGIEIGHFPEDLVGHSRRIVEENVDENLRSLWLLFSSPDSTPVVQIVALKCLLDEKWPKPWLTEKKLERIQTDLENPKLLNSIHRFFSDSKEIVQKLKALELKDKNLNPSKRRKVRSG